MATMRSGYCECGCGRETGIAKRTDASRGDVKGQPKRFIFGHNKKNRPTNSAYRQVKHDGRVTTLHRKRAEMALGRPLPKGVQVHHADGSRDDDAPLVICQDASYHKLLHARMRVKAVGGNPNTDKICTACQSVKPKAAFSANRTNTDGRCNQCKECASQQNKAYRDRQSAA